MSGFTVSVVVIGRRKVKISINPTFNIFSFLRPLRTKLGQVIGSEWSVSPSDDGKTVAVGEPYNERDNGLLRIFSFVDGDWTHKGEDIDGRFNQYFGYSVSFSDDSTTVAIGLFGGGKVKIYNYLNIEQIGNAVISSATIKTITKLFIVWKKKQKMLMLI